MKRKDPPHFDCEPEKFLNALAAMKPHVGYTYVIVCFRIYETGRPCTDSPDVLATRMNMNVRWVKDAIHQLVKCGKLVRIGDNGENGLMNPFAAGKLAEATLINQENLGGASQHPPQTHHPMPPTKNGVKSTNGLGTAFALTADKKTDSNTDSVAATKTTISDVWTLSEKNRITAAEAGFPHPKIAQMETAFRTYYCAPGRRLPSDRIDVAWSKWVSNEIEFARSR